MVGDSLKVSDWVLSSSSFLGAVFNQNNLPAEWKHGAAVNFTHASGRSPFIKLTNQRVFYGLPDTIKLVLNIGNMGISRAIVSLRANNSATSVSTEFNSFVQNKDFSLDIPVDKLFATDDKAIYPIWFDNVNFYLNASAMTIGQSYTLAIKDILLVYNGYIETRVSALKTTRFNIYPNPIVNKILNLQLKQNFSQTIKIEIYNSLGQRVENRQYGRYAGGVIPIQVSNLAPGTYLIKVYENEEYDIAKFVVK
ncbi:MAG: T9SS type A sorting domain-containing protein [Paludibacteraceae bacterium]